MAQTKHDSPVTDIADENKHYRIIRLPKVIDITGKPRSSIYSAMKNGTFPASISLGPRSVGWLESEIVNWVQQRVNAR